MLKVKKLDPTAVLPARANETDAGYDIVAIDDGTWAADGTYIEYRTGLSIQPPTGYHVDLFPRSSVTKTDLILGNGIGLIDNGYRGEVKARFKYIPRFQSGMFMAPPILHKKGDKIAQLVIRKTETLTIEEVTELDDTARGSGGFGSTGR
jgi:dUTP pyrophosphatase